MDLCSVCRKSATGSVNVAASAASSVPSRFERRCDEHNPYRLNQPSAAAGTTAGARLSEAEIAKLRQEHYCLREFDIINDRAEEWDVCPSCSDDWPCSIGRLLEALAASEARGKALDYKWESLRVCCIDMVPFVVGEVDPRVWQCRICRARGEYPGFKHSDTCPVRLLHVPLTDSQPTAQPGASPAAVASQATTKVTDHFFVRRGGFEHCAHSWRVESERTYCERPYEEHAGSRPATVPADRQPQATGDESDG